jgi:nitrous oxide reductase accessory protein NosL
MGILVVAAGRWKQPAANRIMERNASTVFFIMGSEKRMGIKKGVPLYSNLC